MILSRKEKSELVDELRAIYTHCVMTGLVPSGAFLKLGQVLKAESSRKVELKSADDLLYYGTTLKDIETWLESIETSEAPYSDKEREFVEDMRSDFESKRGNDRPLSGKQLKWLQDLYDRS
jgi:hypothetical protein